nr:universal stress protein [Streptomyces sp. Xyl84]
MRAVVAGIDGSRESRAAAEWAAGEAELLGAPLRLVHVWQPLEQAPIPGVDALRDQAGEMLRDVGEGVRRRHSRVEVTAASLPGRPVEVLCGNVSGAELLVLGSRALGGLDGFLVGSVGLSVVAHAERPVVLVRAGRPGPDGGERLADDHERRPAHGSLARVARQPVVLGLDTAVPDDGLIQFAFAAAGRRRVPLRVLHGWNPQTWRTCIGRTPVAGAELHAPAARDSAAVLAEVLRPWRQKYPDIEVIEDARTGNAAQFLVEASCCASLVVVGRRPRPGPFGTHIGPVAHGVLHHALAPVAVVPHG